jgi:pimeloyl-ACP methyl ester carboxylesterase
VVCTGAALLGQAADTTIETQRIGRDLRLSSTRRGSAVIAALNGLIGDRLERSGSELHQPPSVRVNGEPVALNSVSLREAFPDATARLVVFLHGLMATEFCWEWGGSHPRDTYGARLATDLNLTPIYLRYNTGLHISENGRSVAALLEQLVQAWPLEVREIALVGHSLGGLVARSACHYGSGSGDCWTGRVHHIVSLGTPHLGAPLARGAHVAAETLYRLPEARLLGGFLRQRSAGIRDLGSGSLVDEDWRGRDPNALRAAVCVEVPLLEGATHFFVSATITRSPNNAVARLFGDILVLVPSATGQGRTRRIPFEAEHGNHVGSAHHLSLLNHPDVYERLREWLKQPGNGLPARQARALAPT